MLDKQVMRGMSNVDDIDLMEEEVMSAKKMSNPA